MYCDQSGIYDNKEPSWVMGEFLVEQIGG